MTRLRILGLYRLFFSALTGVAITTQLAASLPREGFRLVNFFSFFTIESNIIALISFLLTGVAALEGARRFTLLRGAATLYMTTTLITYHLLLRGLEASLQTTVPWVNLVLHYLMPAAVLADWFFDSPVVSISFRRALRWLLFPSAYVVYTLIRGPLARWYPYPFLNPEGQGYTGVALTCAVMLTGMVVLTALLAVTTGRKEAREKSPA